MSKTVLIGTNNNFTVKANRLLYSLAGILFLINAGFHMFYGTQDMLRFVLGILLAMAAVFYLVYATVGFSLRSRYSPKVKVDEEIIVLKKNLWKPAIQIRWTDVVSIEFKTYKTIFQTKQDPVSFSYTCNMEVSKLIKQTIREFAEQKKIDIAGG